MVSRKVVFMDRDGVINRRAELHHYITAWEEFEVLPGVYEAVRKCNEAGYYVVIVSNQRGIARGLCSMEQIEGLHERMLEEFRQRDAYIDKIYICPHDDGECDCRKPGPGLLYMAEAGLWNERKEKVDRENSWMIGDSESDIRAGRAYGVKTIWIHDPGSEMEVKTDYRAESLYEAVELLLRK